jgi:hypothetical protein
MTPLTKLRTLLTLGAIVGIVPITWSFIGLSPLLAVALFKAPLFMAPVLVISVIGLWGCWKAYAAAMARTPVANDKRVIVAVVIALVWGLAWLSVWALASEWEWYSAWLLLYPMPGITAAIMLYVTNRRVTQACLASG